MKPEFVILKMVNWCPNSETPLLEETCLLRNDNNLTNSLRIHIRMMCEECAPKRFKEELPKRMTNAISKYTFTTFARGFEYSNGLTDNHIEVKCEYKTISDIL